jgi:RNA polymerase sigma factor (TIGR02999 family)
MAATTMRRILVSHARRHRAAKRGGGAVTVTLQEDAAAGADEHSVELIALDEALSALAELDSRQSRVVELRYFAGLSIEETAEALAVSPATVKNEWKMARAWLFNRLAGR